MATVKKPMKKAMKKTAPKRMMMQAPPTASGPMMKKGGVVKAQNGATADSTGFFKKEMKTAKKNLASSYSKSYPEVSAASNKLTAASKNLSRQSNKGKAGYDANGFPVKQKMGGKTSKKK